MEHPLLASLAGLLDNPLTPLENRRYIIQKISENDLADIREILLKDDPFPEQLSGPLPTMEEIQAWLDRWGDRYLPLLDPLVVAELQKINSPVRQLTGCIWGWIRDLLFLSGAAFVTYEWAWWLVFVAVALFILSLVMVRRCVRAGDQASMSAWANLGTKSVLMFAGSILGLVVWFVMLMVR